MTLNGICFLLFVGIVYASESALFGRWSQTGSEEYYLLKCSEKSLAISKRQLHLMNQTNLIIEENCNITDFQLLLHSSGTTLAIIVTPHHFRVVQLQREPSLSVTYKSDEPFLFASPSSLANQLVIFVNGSSPSLRLYTLHLPPDQPELIATIPLDPPPDAGDALSLCVDYISKNAVVAFKGGLATADLSRLRRDWVSFPGGSTLLNVACAGGRVWWLKALINETQHGKQMSHLCMAEALSVANSSCLGLLSVSPCAHGVSLQTIAARGPAFMRSAIPTRRTHWLPRTRTTSMRCTCGGMTRSIRLRSYDTGGGRCTA